MSYQHHEVTDRVFLGLAAASFAGALTILTIETRTIPLIIAAFCFAVTIPINVAAALLLHPVSKKSAAEKQSGPMLALCVVGAAVGFAGIIAMFWHFSEWCGVASLVSAGIAATMMSKGSPPDESIPGS